MKKILALSILALLYSCGDYDYDKLQPYEKFYKEFKDADYSFSAGSQYYRMKDFDYRGICDTLSKVHAAIFQDPEVEKLVNQDVSNWLRDSVFVGLSETMKGSILVDTTNMLLLDNPLDYYMQRKIEMGQSIDDQLFRIRHAMHTARIGDKELYYDIVPTNGKLIEELAEYRIETTGDLVPGYMRNNRIKVITSNLRYFCDLYQIDWYILISSSDFFDDRLALKLTDTTYYYDTDLTRQR